MVITATEKFKGTSNNYLAFIFDVFLSRFSLEKKANSGLFN